MQGLPIAHSALLSAIVQRQLLAARKDALERALEDAERRLRQIASELEEAARQSRAASRAPYDRRQFALWLEAKTRDLRASLKALEEDVAAERREAGG